MNDKRNGGNIFGYEHRVWSWIGSPCATAMAKNAGLVLEDHWSRFIRL